jgi:hypothetical protein
MTTLATIVPRSPELFPLHLQLKLFYAITDWPFNQDPAAGYECDV